MNIRKNTYQNEHPGEQANAEEEPECSKTRENTYHSESPCSPEVRIIRVFTYQNDDSQSHNAQNSCFVSTKTTISHGPNPLKPDLAVERKAHCLGDPEIPLLLLLSLYSPASFEFCDPNARRCTDICERKTCHPQLARWIPSLAGVFSAVFAASAASAASAVSASALSAASALCPCLCLCLWSLVAL